MFYELLFEEVSSFQIFASVDHDPTACLVATAADRPNTVRQLVSQPVFPDYQLSQQRLLVGPPGARFLCFRRRLVLYLFKEQVLIGITYHY